MDFVIGLPRTSRENNAIRVIVANQDSSHLTVKNTHSVDQLAHFYVIEIVGLHGTPMSIVLDLDPRFDSRFWGSFQKAMGTELKLSTAFHPQTDGQLERVIKAIKDMLMACVRFPR